MSTNIAILVIIMCITSQTAQEDECPLRDIYPRHRRKCFPYPGDVSALCCNFIDSPDDSCLDIIPENQTLYIDFTVSLRPFNLPCIVRIENNLCRLENELETLFRRIFRDIQTKDSFRTIFVDELEFNPVQLTGVSVLRLIFSKVVNTNMMEELALAVLVLEKKRLFTILDFNVTFITQIGIFSTRSAMTNRIDSVDWCSSPQLYFCPPGRHCQDNRQRYQCVCDTGYVDMKSDCSEEPVLLEGNLEGHQGRVVYCANDTWYTLCSEAFGPSEARVVCRQLGYDGREARIDKESNFTTYPSTSLASVYKFECSGKEHSLMDCEKQPLSSCCTELDFVYLSCDTDCPEDNYYGPNCTQTCGCLVDNTEFCERYTGSCVCSAGWEGENCTDDVDECALGTDNCTLNEQCENTAGSYHCACVPPENKVDGYCYGSVSVVEDMPFKTNGSQDMTLICNPAKNYSHVLWIGENCSQTFNTTCVFRPVPEEDGNNIYCNVIGTKIFAKVKLNLTYPPLQAPQISGYENGQEMQADTYLDMNCRVIGGKPHVKAVTFSCPGHSDLNDLKTKTGVESGLQFYPVPAEDNGITCTCSAEWEDPTFYELSETRVLRVIEADLSKNIPITVVVVAIICGVALIMCAALIVYGVRRYKRRSKGDTLNRRRMNMFDHSFNGGEITEHYAEIDDASLGDQDKDESGRSKGDNLNHMRVDRFPHSFNGDQITHEYAEINGASLDDHEKEGSEYSRPLSNKLDISRVYTSIIPLSLDYKRSATDSQVKDESNTGYFYGTFFTSAAKDTEKPETVPSEDANDDKHDEIKESKPQICRMYADSDTSGKKDYLHPKSTMPDEVASLEWRVNRPAKAEDKNKYYLHPISTHSCL